MKIRTAALLAAPLALALAASGAVTTATLSTPENPQGWYFSSDHTNEAGVITPTTGTGTWVEDQVGGDPGPGSYLLEVEQSQKARLETTQFNDLTLGDLASFEYSTFKTGQTGYGPSINVMIDPEDPANGFATLVWEANKAGLTIVDGAWQTWDTTVAAGSSEGGWWSPTIGTGTTVPGMNNRPTQLETLVAHFGADSRILSVAVNVGRHGPMTAYVDGLTVRTTEGAYAFDFELNTPPPPPNNAPVAEDGSATVLQGQSTTITLVATDEDGDPLTYAVADDSDANGTIEIVGDEATYTPDPSFNGPASFTFTADDGTDVSEPATITITVLPDIDGDGVVDSAPTTKDDCKKDGWRSFSGPTFKNQGACVSSVASGK